MGYKIIDYEGETVIDNFKTATEAWIYMQKEFTPAYIHDVNMKVVREDNDEIYNNLHDQE